jgi:hypothetical protein
MIIFPKIFTTTSPRRKCFQSNMVNTSDLSIQDENIHLADYFSSPKSYFWSDSQFPQFIMEYTKLNRIRCFQYLFTIYSRLNLSFLIDRSIAISGLLEHLEEDLNTKVRYGILERFLYGSLLWCRPINR